MSSQLQYFNFDINDFEKVAFSNQTKQAIDMLKSLIKLWDSAKDIEGWVIDDPVKGKTYYKALHPILRDMTLNKKQLYIQRLASSISAIFSNKNLTLEKDDLILFLLCKEFFRSLFGCTSFKNMDHILFCRELLDKDLRLQLKNDDDVTWLWLCFTLESNIKIDLELLFDTFPEYSLYGYIGCLYANRVNLTETSQKWLEHFADVAEFLPDCEFNPTLLDALSSPWMLCSYLDIPHRHKIKSAFNLLISNWLRKNVPNIVKSSFVKNIKLSKKDKKIQRVAIFSEKYQSTHAMYRCYHNYIASLKDDYYLTLVTAKGNYDDVSKEDFHNIIEFNYESSYRDLIPMLEMISKECFDVIYYPSIGMATWSMITANLRLAPYQIMSLGHPASSFSPQIDYMLPMGMSMSNDSIQPYISESLIEVNEKTEQLTFHPHPNLSEFQSSILPKLNKISDGVVRIAVNSSIMKVSRRFLQTCQILEKNSSVPLQFHFFPAIKPSFQYQFFETCISEYVNHYVIHPPHDYITYMTALNQCDIALGTFPFGGSNSNIDLSVLGIPKVIRTDSSDLAGYTDHAISTKVEDIGFIRTNSEASFLANAIHLIHNEQARGELAERMRTISFDDVLNDDNSLNKSMYLHDVLISLETNSLE